MNNESSGCELEPKWLTEKCNESQTWLAGINDRGRNHKFLLWVVWWRAEPAVKGARLGQGQREREAAGALAGCGREAGAGRAHAKPSPTKFYFRKKLQKTINVDIRYVLFLIDTSYYLV